MDTFTEYRLIEALWSRIRAQPDRIAVEELGTGKQVSYLELGQRVTALARQLDGLLPRGEPAHVGLCMENSVEWIIADLALLLSGAVESPVPLAFSAEQAEYLLSNAELCLVDGALTRFPDLQRVVSRRPHLQLDASAPVDGASSDTWAPWLVRDRPEVAKVIHTSGTTSRPKGVRIRERALGLLTRELSIRLGENAARRYLSLVPYSLLIEQVSGIYLPLVLGGTIVLLPPGVPPLTGGDAKAEWYLEYIAAARPTFMTVPPSIIEALDKRSNRLGTEATSALSQHLFGAREVPLIACGGAPVALSILESLRGKGIEVYEGYGLSENSSVVSWNSPGQNKLGTAGRPLSYMELRITGDGELLIRGPTLFAGYLGEDPSACGFTEDGFLRTGDIAELDGEGYLRILGRKKNLIITSSGRNISAEWVEGLCRALPDIEDAIVFGDGREDLVAVIVASRPDIDPAELRRQLDSLAPRLPDYARIKRFVRIDRSHPDYRNLVTLTGRPRRQELYQAFRDALESA